jgi:hypothetical protein
VLAVALLSEAAIVATSWKGTFAAGEDGFAATVVAVDAFDTVTVMLTGPLALKLLSPR